MALCLFPSPLTQSNCLRLAIVFKRRDLTLTYIAHFGAGLVSILIILIVLLFPKGRLLLNVFYSWFLY